MKRSLSDLFLAAAFAAALCATATAGVNVTILNADKVKGTIDTDDELETFALDCPAGAKLVVAAKGVKGFQPRLRVFAPDGGEPFEDAIIEKKGSAKLKVAALASSGTYTVEVGGGGTTGEYKLKAAWKTPKKTGAEVQAIAEPSAVPFAAGAGTRVNLKAVASKSSAAVPELVRLVGPNEFELDLSGPGKAASDAAKKIVLPENGDYTLFVRDSGGTGGAVKASVSLKQPKPSKRNVDVRVGSIGNAEGEQFAVSDVVGAGGGAVLVPFPEEGQPPVSAIAGSSVEVPPGAVSSATAIIVATAPDVKPKGSDIGAGPSVFFGPEGLTFKEAVTVTIPFDLTAFAGNTSDLVVYTRDARGKVKEVPGPYTIDLDKGTCSFAVSHFSSFRAARVAPDVSGQNAPFVGAWRETSTDPLTDYILVFEADGSSTQYGVTPEGCFFGPFTPPGTPLADFLEIQGSQLSVDQGEILFDRISRQQVPDQSNCTPFGDIGFLRRADGE